MAGMGRKKTPGRKATAESNETRLARGRVCDDARFTAAPGKGDLPQDYASILAAIKEQISQARLKTVLAANASLVMAYWQIGRTILTRQHAEGWGAKVIDRLSADLREAFPEMKGLSPRNLKYMRAFAAAWPDKALVQGTLAQIGWYQNITLLDKLDSPEPRLWYVRQTIEHGWSQPILVLQNEGQAHRRAGQAITNGVAAWRTRLVESLPAELKGSLPSIEEIEAELVQAAETPKPKRGKKK